MDTRILEYAHLIVKVGVNVQPDQTVVIACPVDCAYFARALADAAYEAGCREVVMRWTDDQLTRMKYLRANDAVFDELPQWYESFCNEYAGQRAAHIHVVASDPEYLKGVSPDRLQRANRVSGERLKDYRSKSMANYFPWCVASIPSPVWAKKVFPESGEAEAVDRLWEAICEASHVGGGQAVARWRDKVSVMSERAEKLNAHRFDRLVLKNALGTNLTIGLPENHQWMACGEKAGNGANFVANIPTEEIFTLPRRDAVDGVMYASKPYVLNGEIIEGIRFTFEGGKIVDAYADSGLERLISSLDTDEGARYLGEVALVPASSPINQMGILFYNTLFDENASCHLAYGRAYPTFTDVKEIDEAEMKRRGMNDSSVHNDVMVGTSDMSIVGVTSDGREIPVFADGEFVI